MMPGQTWQLSTATAAPTAVSMSSLFQLLLLLIVPAKGYKCVCAEDYDCVTSRADYSRPI